MKLKMLSKVIITVIILLTIFFDGQLQRLKFDYDIERLFSQPDPELAYYQVIVRPSKTTNTKTIIHEKTKHKPYEKISRNMHILGVSKLSNRFEGVHNYIPLFTFLDMLMIF